MSKSNKSDQDALLAKKKAFVERTRRENYRASLALEGLTPSEDTEKLTKEELIKKWRRSAE